MNMSLSVLICQRIIKCANTSTAGCDAAPTACRTCLPRRLRLCSESVCVWHRSYLWLSSKLHSVYQWECILTYFLFKFSITQFVELHKYVRCPQLKMQTRWFWVQVHWCTYEHVCTILHWLNCYIVQTVQLYKAKAVTWKIMSGYSLLMCFSNMFDFLSL